jgi:hypothetical protein
MKVLVLLPFICAACQALLAAPAHAQSTRTWVSGVGSDSNSCSRTAPCATWAGAYANTLAGGEIDALDAGGFGALTISKSITLDGGGGQVASVLVSGANGINVAAGATDVVVIRNVRFQGALGNGSNPGGAGINGISFTSGAKLILDHVDINGFNNNCIVMANTNAAMLSVKDSTMENCTAGAILIMPSSVTANAYITNTVMAYSRFGLRVQDNGRATVSQSDASNNMNNGLIATSSSSPSEIDITYSVVANNGANGIITSGANALIRFANTAIFANGQGINTSSGGTITSFTPPTNVNAGNATAGAPNGAAIAQQ